MVHDGTPCRRGEALARLHCRTKDPTVLEIVPIYTRPRRDSSDSIVGSSRRVCSRRGSRLEPHLSVLLAAHVFHLPLQPVRDLAVGVMRDCHVDLRNVDGALEGPWQACFMTALSRRKVSSTGTGVIGWPCPRPTSVICSAMASNESAPLRRLVVLC